MATYRTVHLSFWTDPKVDDEFTPEDKYFYLYLLTNPHTNLCGCYEISMKQMVRETGYSVDTIERLLERMECIHGVIRYDKSTKEVYVLRWGKYNWADSEKTISGVKKQAEYIKSDDFRADILFRLSLGYPYPIQGVSIPHAWGIKSDRYPMQASDTDTVTDTDADTEDNHFSSDNDANDERHASEGVSRMTHRKSKRFVPPTLEEVQAYCKERHSTVNPKTFWEYYNTGDWKDSKGNAVKNWKQKIITWERSRNESSSRPAKPNTVMENEGDVDVEQYL